MSNLHKDPKDCMFANEWDLRIFCHICGKEITGFQYKALLKYLMKSKW